MGSRTCCSRTASTKLARKAYRLPASVPFLTMRARQLSRSRPVAGMPPAAFALGTSSSDEASRASASRSSRDVAVHEEVDLDLPSALRRDRARARRRSTRWLCRRRRFRPARDLEAPLAQARTSSLVASVQPLARTQTSTSMPAAAWTMLWSAAPMRPLSLCAKTASDQDGRRPARDAMRVTFTPVRIASRAVVRAYMTCGR